MIPGRTERIAGAAVIAASAAVAAAGIKLIRRYNRYRSAKAAAFFDEKNEEGAEKKNREGAKKIDTCCVSC